MAWAKFVIYDGFQAAVAGGGPKEQAGILVDLDPARLVDGIARNPS